MIDCAQPLPLQSLHRIEICDVTGCDVSDLVWMVGYQPGVSGAIEEGSNADPASLLAFSRGSDPLA